MVNFAHVPISSSFVRSGTGPLDVTQLDGTAIPKNGTQTN
jgi:hypothetical protein